MLNRFLPYQERLGHRDDFVEFRIRGVGDRQLHVAIAFGKIFRLSLIEPELKFVLPQTRQQLADE